MKPLLFALAAETVAIGVLLTVAADIVAHKRVERLGGVNMWGYRGPVLDAKKPFETRIAVAGGDLAFGWGVAPTETTAAYVRRLVGLVLEVSGSPRVVTAATLGARGLPAAEYAAWIDRYAALRPDVLCLVLDPPNHTPLDGRFLPDRASRLFRRYGYSPILPLVLAEKAAVARSRSLRTAARVAGAVDRAIAVSADPAAVTYDEAVAAAVRAGLRAAPAGVVVGVPAPVDGGFDSSAVAERIAARYAGDRRVRVVDLGRDAALRTDAFRLDGFDFSAGGHARVAERLAPSVLELLK